MALQAAICRLSSVVCRLSPSLLLAAMCQAGAGGAARRGCCRFDMHRPTNDPPHSSPSYSQAFGDYIDEVLRMGKGLKVPKFGNFTCVKNSTRDTVPGIKGFTFW